MASRFVLSEYLWFAFAVGVTVASTSGCHDAATPADFVGTWRFVEGEATIVFGAGSESDMEVDDVTGDTFEIELGTGGADLFLILEEFEDCPFALEMTGDWASATSGANGTCHFVDQPAEYDVDLGGAVIGIDVSAGSVVVAYALSGTLTFDGDMGDYRGNVIGSAEKLP